LRGVTQQLSTQNGCDVNASRLELVSSDLIGSLVPACVASPPYPVGGSGMTLTGASRVQIALSHVMGGAGAGCADFMLHGGNGGAGIGIHGASTLIITGGGATTIAGGGSGGDAQQNDCINDGDPGVAIHNAGGLASYSAAVIACLYGWSGMHCIPYQDCTNNVIGPLTLVTPDDPTLDVSGNPAAGQTVQFTLRAPPGSSAILYFGRTAIVVPTPNVVIEQLTPKSRIIDLGVVPASGIVAQSWPIASVLPPGTMLIAQAEITINPSDVRRTNSVPVILR
jgi:hypothetical protein